jgi:hypothetical protein
VEPDVPLPKRVVGGVAVTTVTIRRRRGRQRVSQRTGRVGGPLPLSSHGKKVDTHLLVVTIVTDGVVYRTSHFNISDI